MSKTNQTNIYEAAGYKFRWVKKQTISDGCPCFGCNKTFPIGTAMYLKGSRWLGEIIDSLCSDCYKKVIIIPTPAGKPGKEV